MRTINTTILIALLATAAYAATPPDRINYEGVLRDSADVPVDATHDVVFRLFDAETLGSEMLIDQHLAAGTGAVTFDNGLFNAQIGGGNVLDGSGPGSYTSLMDLFRDYGDLWLEIEVAGETLSPRLPVLAAGHAMNAENATTLGGLPAGNFIDTSGTTQTKTGGLNVDGIVVVGGSLDFGGPLNSTTGAAIRPTSDVLRLEAGSDDTDDIWLVAGNDNTDGRIVVEGDAGIGVWSGGGNITFGRADTGETMMSLLPGSNQTTLEGDLDVNGDDIFLGAGANLTGFASGLLLQAGVSATDDLWLRAGSGSSNGSITIQGNSTMLLDSGNGAFSFRNAAGTELAGLDAGGSLQIDGNLTVDGGTLDHGGDLQLAGDLTVTGDDVFFGGGARIQTGAFSSSIYGGDSTGDDLILRANQSTLSQGMLEILGGSLMRFRSGSGSYQFLDTAGSGVALLDNVGDLQINGDLTVSGGQLDFGAGTTFSATPSALLVFGGNAVTDDLILRGNNLSQTRINLYGDAEIEFRSDTGTFQFLDGNAVELANLNASGDLQMDGDLTVTGNQLDFGGGARFSSSTTAMWAYGGNAANDSLYLRANSASADTTIDLFGGAEIEMESGSGSFEFWDRSGVTTLIGWLTSTAWDIAGELRMDGGDLYMVYSGSDQTQDLHFREAGLASGERFQWDDPAHRFEVSDDFHVFGTLTATTKNFVQNHPYRDDLEIVYTSLEGDEATAFTRGFAKLEAGEARVTLGETFAYVVNPDLGLSAHLTPRGDWADLYVAELTADELVVRAAPGSPDVAFDFIVYGLRIGHEDFPVLRPKRAEAFLPLDGTYDADRGGDPALADAAALARYRRMARLTFGTTEFDFTRAQNLKAAIGQRDVQFDYPAGSDRSVAAILAEEAGALVEIQPTADTAAPPAAEVVDLGPAAGATTGASPAPLTATVDPDGDVYADSFRPAASELATMLPAGEALGGGDVVAIDPVSGRMVLARQAADQGVIGVVAAEPGVILGARQPDGEGSEPGFEDIPVAMSGIVLCKVDASYGAIRPGDLLISSDSAGYAMRADGPAPGTVLGKALEPLEVGSGLIRVLVTLR